MIDIGTTYFDLELYFSRNTIARGQQYADAGQVYRISTSINHIGEGIIVEAEVTGRSVAPYETTIHFENNEPIGFCSCPVGYNCKHIVATLIAFQNQIDKRLSRVDKPVETTQLLNDRLDYIAQNWIETLSQSLNTAKQNEMVVYIISPSTQPPWRKTALTVKTYITRALLKGGLGKPQPFYPSTDIKRARVSQEDLEIYGLLDMITTNTGSKRNEYHIPHNTPDYFFQKILASGRCYWETLNNAPLQQSNQPIEAHLEWTLEKSGEQALHCKDHLGQPLDIALPLTPPWHITPASSSASPIKTTLPSALASALLAAPSLQPNQSAQMVKHLQKLKLPGVAIPLPKAFKKIERKYIQPTPNLTISKNEVLGYNGNNMPDKKSCFLGNLEFSYDGHTFSDYSNEETILKYFEDDRIIEIKRDLALENQYRSQLKKFDILPMTKQFDFIPEKMDFDHYYLIAEEEDVNQAIGFSENILPKLKEEGWGVELEDDQFYDMVSIDEWYTELDDQSENDWFNLDLGVMINDEKLSLLPYLLETIDHLAFSEDQDKYYLRLPEGKVLPLPVERIKHIVNTLTQFIDPTRFNSSDSLKLSRYQASVLAEMEKAFNKTKMRWLGGERLRALGKRLSNFSAIKTASPPKRNFKATLRPYQQQGLNWLQFLREYELNGILADDMGLGKTLQTLGHISIEKQKKHLTQPCLIVAPTSVISNWEQEAHRFTPSLRVLNLRAPNRKARFNEIPEHDIVLSTYPLIVRDKEDLLNYQYHLLVLDEAQYIKNAQSKIAQVVQQFQAKHRLCLTGTPLENHLGELWSLFNFLMPGLLGNSKYFSQHYRKPIEKHQSKEALNRLTKIVKPFILRRTKEEVAQDLPEKSEIIHKVTLDNRQRDLYESIRLAMHKKVKAAIDKKGIERCQIIILDALLKLRQACCDPRLVKLASASKIKSSAKLQSLIEMIENMLEEGRRILLFSQFTSMLKLIEAELTRKNIRYVTLTGATKDRIKPVNQFQSGEVPIFLISLKAGGTGLNLTAADTIIHYDPWWNPAVENQATDRAYRIGQDKPVFVYKMVAEDTVEEKILQMQEKKQSLMKALFDGDKNNAKLSKQDLDYLLS